MNEDDLKGLAESIEGILPGEARVRISGAASLGAQRDTWFLDVAADAGGASRAAVAQVRSSPLAVSDIELEARAMSEAMAAGVAVPEVLAWDVELGAIVSDRVEGESIPRRILRLVAAHRELGSQLTRDCGEALARLHRLEMATDPRLADYFEPASYIDELTETLDGLSVPHPTFRLGINWLHRNTAAVERAPGASFVHGDFRLGNLLVTKQGLSAVLDWELVHRGDAMEDLAWLCLRTWRFGQDQNEVGGFGGREELRAAYESAGGMWRESAFEWWTVARTIWWGLGLARQVEAFLAGESNSIVLAASGRRVVELEYDLLQRIAK